MSNIKSSCILKQLNNYIPGNVGNMLFKLFNNTTISGSVVSSYCHTDDAIIMLMFCCRKLQHAITNTSSYGLLMSLTVGTYM